MYCTKCGALLGEGATFCGNCGQAANIASPMPPAVPVASPVATGTAAPMPPSWSAAAPQPRMAYAGFWLRFVSYIMDSVIVGIPLFVVLGILIAILRVGSALENIQAGDTPENVLAALGFLFVFLAIGLSVVGAWLYYSLLESSSWQATLGKKALGLYVTDSEGRRMSFGRATGRFFAKLVTGLIPFAIGYIMAGFTARKQALHDMIAGCLVLRRL